MATPLDFYPGFLDKTNFPRILTRRARYPKDPSTIPTRSRPWTLPRSPVVYRCWGHQHRSPVPIYTLGLDKTNSPRILNPTGRRGQQYPKLALGPVRDLWLRGGLPGVRTTFTHMATPLNFYPGFLDKTNFSRILTRRARYPQDPSTIFTRSRPWTLPGSAVVYRFLGHPAQVSCAHLHSGARWNEFSPNTKPPRGKGGNNTHNSQKVPYVNFDFGVGWPVVRTTFNHMAIPLVLYPGFLDKMNFPRIPTHRARYRTVL